MKSHQTFSPTFVKDLAKAVVLGCQLKLKGAYNVANSEFFTRVELAKQFVSMVGKDVEIILKSQEEFNFDDPRQNKSYIDGSRFIKETQMNFTTMREVIQSYLTHTQLILGT